MSFMLVKAIAQSQAVAELGLQSGGEQLGDQLLLIALAKSGSFLTGKVSRHTRTNIDTMAMFYRI